MKRVYLKQTLLSEWKSTVKQEFNDERKQTKSKGNANFIFDRVPQIQLELIMVNMAQFIPARMKELSILLTQIR